MQGWPTLQASPGGSDFSIQFTLVKPFLLLCQALSWMPLLFVATLLGGCLSVLHPYRG